MAERVDSQSIGLVRQSSHPIPPCAASSHHNNITNDAFPNVASVTKTPGVNSKCFSARVLLHRHDNVAGFDLFQLHFIDIDIDIARLRELVTEAARRDVDDSALDLQGIVWLEHINWITGEPRSLVEKFYLEVLGCTPDAGKSFHVNLGQQQFHLAVAKDSEAPQAIAGGSIGLAVPNSASLRDRVQAAVASKAFNGTQFRLVTNDPDCVTLQGPWGNTFHCYSIQNEVDDSLEPNSTMKMVNAHADGSGMYGSHRMAVRNQPDIRYMEFPCPHGQATALASFYRHVMNCIVHTQSQSDDDSSNEVVTVSVGPGVHLPVVFVENERFADLQQASQGFIFACIRPNMPGSISV